MLLAVDIGNSRIKFGVFDREKLLAKVSIPATRDITPHAISSVLNDKLPQRITASIVCSVVPEIEEAVRGFAVDRSGVEPIMVTNDLDLGLKINYQPLEDAGTDRLVNAISAAEKYGVPCIVCSFGTATTIDFINKEREFVGGLIAPGMNTLAEALKQSTSRLPQVEIVKPEKVLQNTTVGSIQSGIVNGYFGLVDGLLTAVKDEIGGAKVVATGGSASMVAENTRGIDVVDNDLTLYGLRRLYERLNA